MDFVSNVFNFEKALSIFQHVLIEAPPPPPMLLTYRHLGESRVQKAA